MQTTHTSPTSGPQALISQYFRQSTHLIVELAVDGVSCSIDHLEGVGAIAIHVAVAIGDAPVTKEERDLVGGLRTKGDEVPEHVHILEGREGGWEEGREE